jgi:replicative DNA helicase
VIHPDKTNSSDAAMRWERALLGSVLEEPGLFSRAELSSADFLLGDHRKIWDALRRLHDSGEPADIVSVAAAAPEVAPAYIGGLICAGTIPANFTNYAKHVRAAAAERRFDHLQERLGSTSDRVERLQIIGAMREILAI